MPPPSKLPPNDDYFKMVTVHDVDLDQMEKDITELFNRLSVIENNFYGYSARISALEGSTNQLEDTLDDMDLTLEGISSRVTTLESTLSNHQHSYTSLTNIPSEFNPTNHGNERHTTAFIAGVTWSQIANKPSLFPPEPHGNAVHNPQYAPSNHVHQYDDAYYPGGSGVGNEPHTHSFASTTKMTGGPV